MRCWCCDQQAAPAGPETFYPFDRKHLMGFRGRCKVPLDSLLPAAVPTTLKPQAGIPEAPADIPEPPAENHPPLANYLEPVANYLGLVANYLRPAARNHEPLAKTRAPLANIPGAPATCHGRPALCRSPEEQRNPSADVSMDRQPLRPGSFHGPRIVQSLSRRPHPGTGRRGDPPQSRRHPPRHRALAGCGTSCKHKTHPASQGGTGINKSASHAAPGLFNQGRRRSLRYRCDLAAYTNLANPPPLQSASIPRCDKNLATPAKRS